MLMQRASAEEDDEGPDANSVLAVWRRRVAALVAYCNAREDADPGSLRDRVLSRRLFLPLVAAAAGVPRLLDSLELDLLPRLTPSAPGQADAHAHEIKLSCRGEPTECRG